MRKKAIHAVGVDHLRLRAEERVRKDVPNAQETLSPQQVQRVLHDLQVHQIELEMQNEELRRVQTALEISRERYFDLYDLAPVGYFTLNEQGVILEANLTATQLIGVERGALVQQPLPCYLLPDDQDIYYKCRKALFKTGKPQVCEVRLKGKEGAPIWVCIESTLVRGVNDPPTCRAVMSDITTRKAAEIAQRRLDALTASNRKLEQEIIEREAVEESLKQSEQHQSELLEQSRTMQTQLRHLSHQVLMAQEEERKRISRELHDVIAQTLTGINVRLALLKKEAALNPKGLDLKIASTQQLVEESLEIVHQFARKLRPPVLDDLGLIPALHSFTKSFTESTGIHIHLTVFAGVEALDIAKRTVLYRVVQEALTNVARHAQASRVEVSVLKLPRAVCLTLSDNGKSFHVERVLLATNNKHLGLVGMRERVEMVGGSFSVESAPGVGTTIRAQIPFLHRTKKPIPG
jgi:PAS domain S-box-containing protein